MKTFIINSAQLSEASNYRLFGKPVGRKNIEKIVYIFNVCLKNIEFDAIKLAFEECKMGGIKKYSSDSIKVYNAFSKYGWELENYNLGVAEIVLDYLEINNS